MPDLDALKSAGLNVDELSAAQQDALGNLSDDEIKTLAQLHSKLSDPEVSGHARAAAGDGIVVW